MDDIHRTARLDKIFLPWMKRRSYILMETLKMGYPQFYDSDDLKSTAYVEITRDGRVRFCWNRKFFDSISDLAVEYVAFHEALHLILNHCGRCKDRVPIVWNIACDLVVNRELDAMYERLLYLNYRNVQQKALTGYSVHDDPFLKQRLTFNNYPFLNSYYARTAEELYDILIRRYESQLCCDWLFVGR